MIIWEMERFINIAIFELLMQFQMIRNFSILRGIHIVISWFASCHHRFSSYYSLLCILTINYLDTVKSSVTMSHYSSRGTFFREYFFLQRLFGLYLWLIIHFTFLQGWLGFIPSFIRSKFAFLIIVLSHTILYICFWSPKNDAVKKKV